MAVWKVQCRPTPQPPEACEQGALEGGVATFEDEVTAQTEYALHAGHGYRNLHYCNDGGPPEERWDDRNDPQARYEEGV